MSAFHRLHAIAVAAFLCCCAGAASADTLVAGLQPIKDVTLVPPQPDAAQAADKPVVAAEPVDYKQYAFGESLADLGFFLLKEARRTNGGPVANSLVSPFSVANVLGVLHAGAAGSTASEIAGVVQPGTMPAEKLHDSLRKLNDRHRGIDGGAAVKWTIASRIWSDAKGSYKPAPKFLAQVQDAYRTDMASVNMNNIAASRTAINDWAKQATDGKIPALIPEQGLPPNTRVVLTNAVHFFGTWLRQFDPSRTQPAPFHNADGSETAVPTMAGVMEVREGKSGKLNIVELPYTHRDFALLILMPDKDVKLDDIEPALEGADIGQWMYALKTSKIDLRLPRFSIPGQSLSLKSALRHAGMHRAFSPDADFTPMLGKSGVTISDIFHGAGIEVNEAGSEAVAGTAAIGRAKSLPPLEEAPVRRIDRPFIFVLAHTRTGTPLFMGRIASLK